MPSGSSSILPSSSHTSTTSKPTTTGTTSTRRKFRSHPSRQSSSSTLRSILNPSEYRSHHLPLPSARFKAVLGYKRTYSNDAIAEHDTSNNRTSETSTMPHGQNGESQPLLPDRRGSTGRRTKTFDPIGSTRHLLLGSWLSLFLVFLPLAFVSEKVGWSAAVRFTFSFLAIIPLAKLLGDATEQLSMKLGQTLGGLLNATFGNAVELIVAIAALVQNELRLVQMSLLGSVLSNLLLVLGMSFAASGFYFYEATFQMTAAQASSSLMTLACITLILPAAYHFSENDAAGTALTTYLKNGGPAPEVPDSSLHGLLILSRGTSIILLLTYILYLIFQLRTHAGLFEAEVADGEEEEEADMDQWSAGAWLVLVTVATAFTADILVGSIDETAEQLRIPKRFIGLILLPLVGNAAEHVTSVWMACKGKMELTIGVSVGSSIQIAAGMIPLLVIIAWGMDKDLTLFFANFETVTLFVSVMLVNLLLQDGRANYMEGVMLIALYLVIALAYSVSE